MKMRNPSIISLLVCLLLALAAAPALADGLVRSWQFNTPGDTEGWRARSTWTMPQGVHVATDVDGVATVLTSEDISGQGDCGILLDASVLPIELPAEFGQWSSFSVRLRHLDANPPAGEPIAFTGGANLWITGAGGTLGELPAVSEGLWRVESQSDGWAVYTINLKGNSGTITALRLDPYSGLDGNFEIDWIELRADDGGLPREPTTLYLDALTGDDTSGDGSIENPWRTLDRAWPELIDGDVVELAAGAYPAFSAVASAAGGWPLFNDWVTIRPAEGAEASIEQLSLTYHGVLEGSYDAYVRFENIHFLNGVNLIAPAHLAFVDCLFETFPPWTGSAEVIDGNKAFSFGGVADLLVQGCEVTNTTLAICGSGREIRILDNHIHDIKHDGIRVVGWKDSLIEGNRIHGVDDEVTDDEASWSRHCDVIHIFIAGPGTPGMECDNVVIRDNILYDAEAQILQVNNYLKSDLRNQRLCFENNIFGPSRANAFNCGSGVDGLVFRNNTFVYLDEPRYYGRWLQDNNTFRVGGGSTGVQVYNNILYSGTPDDSCQVDILDYNVYQGGVPVPPVGVDGSRAFGRHNLFSTDVLFVDADAFDGALQPASPAIDFGTRAFAPTPIRENDIAGTLRDLRPDAGAWELPGRSPVAEALPPDPATGEISVYLDDFEDGSYIDVDPWLNAPGQQGMSWMQSSEAAFKFTVQDSTLHGSNALYDPRGTATDTRVAWLFSEQGGDWADYDFSFDVGNSYLAIGSGVLLLAQDEDNCYWLEIARDRGRLLRYLDGVETVLAEEPAIEMFNNTVRLYTVNVRHGAGGEITISCDADRDGTEDFSFTDDDPAAVACFAAGGVGFHNGDVIDVYHRAIYDNVRVDVLARSGAPLAGDADGDGFVNVSDFIVLKQNYNTASGATWDQGDFNGDGAVDVNDFILLKQNYNR